MAASTTSPQWDMNTYSLLPNNVATGLHPFQAYILKMAALDYVGRPPPLTASGEDAEFYDGFEAENDLLLKWVLGRGFSHMEDLPEINNVFHARPLVIIVLESALEASFESEHPIPRFSELPLPVQLSPYASRNSAGLSGFRLNVLWAAAKRYAESMVESAANDGCVRYLMGDTDNSFGTICKKRCEEGVVYIEDVNLAMMCASNAGVEEFIFSRKSSCAWWWDEPAHADRIRELLKDVVRLALEVACKHAGVGLIYDLTCTFPVGRDIEAGISHPRIEELDLDQTLTRDQGADDGSSTDEYDPANLKIGTPPASPSRLSSGFGDKPYTRKFFTPLNARLPNISRPYAQHGVPSVITQEMKQDYPKPVYLAHLIQRRASYGKKANKTTRNQRKKLKKKQEKLRKEEELREPEETMIEEWNIGW